MSGPTGITGAGFGEGDPWLEWGIILSVRRLRDKPTVLQLHGSFVMHRAKILLEYILIFDPDFP
jgi:hypothetical protein